MIVVHEWLQSVSQVRLELYLIDPEIKSSDRSVTAPVYEQGRGEREKGGMELTPIPLIYVSAELRAQRIGRIISKDCRTV